MSPRRASRLGAVLLLALVAAAAGLRVWAWSRMGSSYLSVVEPEEGYYEQGVGWLSHGVLSSGLTDAEPRLWRGPVYPAFLALTEAPFSAPWASHPKLAQALLSALAVGLAFWLGGLLGGRAAAWAAALLLAFDPGQVLSANSLNVHAFYGLSLLALAGAAALWAASPTRRNGLLLGAALGASLLVRSTHFLAVPLTLAAGLRRREDWESAARRAAWPLAALAAVLLPWTARNALFFRVLQPLDSYSGAVNLYAASRGKVQTASVEDAVRWASEDDPGLAEAYRSDRRGAYPRLLALAARRIAAEPAAYARGAARRWWALFKPWLPLLAAAGIAAWRRGSRPAWAALSVLVSLSAYALIAIQAGYAEALRPLAAVFAGLALAELPPLSRRRAPPPEPEARAARGLALACAAVLGLAFAASLVLLAREAALAGPWSPPRAGGGPRVFAAGGSGAEKLLRELARRDATGVERLRLGVYDSMIGDPMRACPEFELAARAPRTRAAARAALADCLLARARLHSAARRDGAAAEDLARAEALAPSDPGVRRGLIAADLGAGRLSAAEGRLRRALAAPAPPAERAGLRAALAGLLWRRGDAAAARKAFAAALAEDAARACRPPEGLVDPSRLPSPAFDACLARFPGDARLLADRGVALWLEQRPADALASLRAALAADPGDLAAALSLSAALGGKDDAKRILTEALRASREPARSPLRGEAERALAAPP